MNAMQRSDTEFGSDVSLEEKVLTEARNILDRIPQLTEQSTSDWEDLYNLCRKTGYTEILCLNEDLSLLPYLKQILEMINDDDDDDCLSWILCCITQLATGGFSCKAAVSSKELALLPVLMKILRSASSEYIINSSLIAISNCSLFEGCHDYLLSSEVGWLDYLEKTIHNEPNDAHSYRWFVKLVSNMRSENILVLIEHKIVEVILSNVLCYGADRKKWSKEEGEVVDLGTSFIMFFSKLTVGSRYLKELFSLQPQYDSFFFELLSTRSSSLDGVKVMIVLANLYGREENNERGKALLSSHSDILPFLIDIMDATMNWNVNRRAIKELLKKGFRFAEFGLSVTVVALKNLSISDENKKIMIKYPSLIGLSCQGIKLFVDNASECEGMRPGETFYQKAGGGGKDFLTVEGLLELLLQLSFLFEDESSLHKVFTNSCFDLKTLMEDLLNLPLERNVSFEARLFAQQLLAKLNSQDSDGIRKELSDTVAQHVMLSYSWSANKDLVVAFGKKLREMGYDVWRDEEGSSVLGPMSMSGNTLDAMTAAVEKSYMMIIFVSPEYKESANCRTEGLYGFKRSSNSSLKLVYVMMNENFTTETRPIAVDGWLAGMIGADLWYPLWKMEQLNAAVTAVAAIGNAAKPDRSFLQGSSPRLSPLSSPFSFTTAETTMTSRCDTFRTFLEMKIDQDSDFVAAFECLQKEKSLSPDCFEMIFQNHSISDPEDLRYADMMTVMSLCRLLKPRFRIRFLDSLKL
jgi:hypothetical protein